MIEETKEDLPINRGEIFMRDRRSRKEKPEEVEPKLEELPEAWKMDSSLITVITASIIVGGTLIGFILGWFASAYCQSYMETVGNQYEQSDQVTHVSPHPEMMDADGNPLPFQVTKLISVEFDPTDSFTTDPFPED